MAFASVAGALLLDLLFHRFNLPHPFAAFALSAIAITFWYGGTKPGIVAVLLSSLIRGFIVTDFAAKFPDFIRDMPQWVKEGKIKYREDIAEGLENAPQTFIGLLKGKNFGKQLVRVVANLSFARSGGRV